MLEAGDSIQKLLFHTGKQSQDVGVARIGTDAPQLCQCEVRELGGAREVLQAVFIVDGQLLVGVNAVPGTARRLVGQVAPQQSGIFMVALALGEQRQLAAGLRPKFGGEAEIERLRTSGVCTAGIAAALEETRKAE
jgi:hypothetical protein